MWLADPFFCLSTLRFGTAAKLCCLLIPSVQTSCCMSFKKVCELHEVKKTMEHLLRLVESAPLLDLQHRVGELLKTGERSLEDQRGSLEGLGDWVGMWGKVNGLKRKRTWIDFWSLRKMKDCCRLDVQEGLLDRLRHFSLKNRTFADMRATSDALVVMHQKMELPLFLPQVDAWLLNGWTGSSDRSGGSKWSTRKTEAFDSNLTAIDALRKTPCVRSFLPL